jgi:fructose-bisphosphate aldolase class II
LRIASYGAMRKYMVEDKKNFDPRKLYKVAQQAMTGICKARYEAFCAAGQASKIKVIGLEEMNKRYSKGELDPIVN